MISHRQVLGAAGLALLGTVLSISACSSDDDATGGTNNLTGDACGPAVDTDGSAAGDGGATGPAAATGGKLFIIGGAVTDQSIIWNRVLTEGGGAANVHFLVVTAATSLVTSNFAYYKDVLNRLNGVSLDNIRQLQVGDQDDEASKFIDESSWRDGADAPDQIAAVRDWATVVWFAGGDQAHIMSTFVNPDGSDRGVTKAIREKLAAGKLIVAGTSAGAAIMSNPMIGEGDPYKSWLNAPRYTRFYEDKETDGGVYNAINATYLNQGLGFLNATSNVMIDTHWFQRARLARTIRAIDFASSPDSLPPNGLNPKMKVGLGIGENTGILIDTATGIGEVVGDPDASWVAVMDMNGATTNGMNNPYSGENIRVGYLGVRDRFTLPTDANPSGVFLHEASKTRYLPCNGARNIAPITGDLFVSGGYVDALQNLLDGPAVPANTPCRVEGFGSRVSGGNSGNGQPFQVSGFFFRFTADAKTREFYSDSWGWEIENAIMRFGTGTGTYTPPF